MQDPSLESHAIRCGGFTLLEVLVTLIVLGLLLATLEQGIRFGLRAWSMEQTMGSRISGLETTDRALRLLISGSSPGDPASREAAFTGGAHEMSFITTLPEGFGAPVTHEVDARLLVASGHRLELRWRPHYRQWIMQPPAPTTTILLDGVDHLDLAYLSTGTGIQGQRWLSGWTGQDLPKLVRVHVAFPADDARRWPDIVVPTMRERPVP